MHPWNKVKVKKKKVKSIFLSSSEPLHRHFYLHLVELWHQSWTKDVCKTVTLNLTGLWTVFISITSVENNRLLILHLALNPNKVLEVSGCCSQFANLMRKSSSYICIVLRCGDRLDKWINWMTLWCWRWSTYSLSLCCVLSSPALRFTSTSALLSRGETSSSSRMWWAEQRNVNTAGNIFLSDACEWIWLCTLLQAWLWMEAFILFLWDVIKIFQCTNRKTTERTY